jgi:hypothetical protein
MRGLPIASLKAPLTLSDAEAPESLDVPRRVVSPAALSTAGEWQRSESLPEPEPARSYAECIGGFSDGECLLSKHTPTLKL